MKNKKILIIGCQGYLGSALTDYLISKGYECYGIDIGFFKNCNFYKNKKFKIKKKSASKINKKDLELFDIVIHLAAFSNDPYGGLKENEFYKPTTRYTLKIAKICKKLNIKFIFPSSCSVYGYGKKIFTEKSKVNPLTFYSKNKIEIEKALLKIADNNFRPIILRLATVYGISPRIRFDVVVNMLCGMGIAMNKITLNSNGLAWRPHLDIYDVCRIFEKFINFKIKSNSNLIYNIGDDKNNLRIVDIVKIIKKYLPNVSVDFLNSDISKKKNLLAADKKIQDGIDRRSYKVSFKLIHNLFKNFKFKKIDKGIQDLLINLKKKLSKKTFLNINFYRLQKLEKINNTKKIFI